MHRNIAFQRTKILYIYLPFIVLILLSSLSCTKDRIDSTPNPPTDVIVPPRSVNEIFDIVIYGSTPAGIAAALEATRSGKKVIVINPDKQIGGMLTGGLSFSDIGDTSVIGGIAKEFFKRAGTKYGQNTAEYRCEPHVALETLKDMVLENKLYIYDDKINLDNGVLKDGSLITTFISNSGVEIKGKQFIDASYEGDLMKCAGISYILGRESSSTYGESLNGVLWGVKVTGDIIPDIDLGQATRGLIPRINRNIPIPGSSDDKIQGYNYRVILTKNAANKVDISQPPNFNENDYLLLFKLIEKGSLKDPSRILSIVPIKGGKFDCNNGSWDSYLSSDYIGGNTNYIEGNYETRYAIAEEHKNHILGLLWTLQHSKRIPEHIRTYYLKFGLAKDEFTENKNWPTQLYIREARRMISDYVILQNTVLGKEYVPDPIGMGSYNIDCHYVQYYIGANGFLYAEGLLDYNKVPKYPISFRSLIPKKTECTNLTVPVCLSASHVAYSTLRMEPQYMILGQACGAIASLAIDYAVDVQDLEYGKLKQHLASREMRF